jgi:type II secretion system protein G
MPLLERTRSAFTLIELLIVVAIIAILAAIAVPNFLEAQVRSKVSRAKADMRTIATGLESYHVDRNKYPPAYDPDGTTKNPRIERLIPLTTPISYLTSVPRDIFNIESAASSPSATDAAELQIYIYADRRSYSDFVNNPFGISSNGDNLYRILWGFQFPSSQWLLRSRGPRGTGSAADGANLGNSVDKTDAYDPTNGTVSRGNIFMLGPGVGFLDEGK